jgi:uncharacterized membrane protein affecting hemolysin expression
MDQLDRRNQRVNSSMTARIFTLENRGLHETRQQIVEPIEPEGGMEGSCTK